MHPICIDQLGGERHAELDHANRTATDGRLRVGAPFVLLAAERRMVAADFTLLTADLAMLPPDLRHLLASAIPVDHDPTLMDSAPTEAPPPGDPERE